MVPAATVVAVYHPATMLKLYVYDYQSLVQSSRRLEREAQRNIELMWLTQRLAGIATISDFRRDNGAAITAACAWFVMLCCDVGLLNHGITAIDGSKSRNE